MEKENIFGKTLTHLEALIYELQLPKFTAKQLAQWLYKSKVTSFDEMSNISLKGRELLTEKYKILRIPHEKESRSPDGTVKYLFRSSGNKFIETVYIPEKERATLCVSSQVGCKMGCLFCMTGKQGFQGHLTAGEILNQIVSVPHSEILTNIVYMGMGEPFDNIEHVITSVQVLTEPWGFEMAPRRITVSTIGIIPGIIRFLGETQAHLAISLHSPFEDERKSLMPVESVYSLHRVLDTVKNTEWGRQRRVSFEYIMFKGINDSKRHVNELVKILHGIPCRINLIRFHEIPGIPFKTSEQETIEWFRDELKSKGIMTTIRASRGQDIEAACGLLSTKESKPDATNY